MVTIFHGTDSVRSRDALNQHIAKFPNHSNLRLEGKEITLDLVNNFLNSTSLFADDKLLVLFDFLGQPASILKSLVPIIEKSDHEILIYASKALTPTQLKTFPKTKVIKSSLSSSLFLMLSALKPHNQSYFFTQLTKTLSSDPPELIAFMIRRKIREYLSRPSGFSPHLLNNTYLALIDMDWEIKSGQNPFSLPTLLVQKLVPLFAN
jgi:hypothetical protein